MSDTSKNWFDVSRKGLAQLIERRGGSGGAGSEGGGKISLLFELIANALDADGVTRIEVVLEPEQGVPHATVVVRDDAPEGFADLTRIVKRLAAASAKGRIVSVLEGGYNLDALAASAEAHLRALME